MAEKGSGEMTGKEAEVKVVVFDLNGTFYNKSSKDEFFKFVGTKEPKQLKHIFQMGYYKVLHKLHQIRQTEFKENFFNYLNTLPPEKVKAYAEEFWEKEYPEQFNQELKNRFDKLKEQGVQLICATGALELYVKPLFQLYRIDGLVGTRVTYTGETYLVQGEACKEEEKLKRIDKLFDGLSYTIVEAYSDSKEAILEKARKAYLIEDGKISSYKST